jgi:hypothetical protein
LDDSRLNLSEDINLKVVLAPSGGAVEGIVIDDNLHALPDAVVALIPDAPLRPRSLLSKEQFSDAKGRFRFRGVAPGKYKLFAWSDLPGAAYRNEDFLKKFSDKVGEITVTQGIIKSDVRVLP